MGKKIIILVVVLLILGGAGFFYWWQRQADVREMNKGLPEGVRVSKSLSGEYKVVNKKDGYVVAVPEAWKGLSEVKYSPLEEEVMGLLLIGIEGEGIAVEIDVYKLKQSDIELKSWAQNKLQEFELTAEILPEIREKFKPISETIKEEKIGDFGIIKAKAEHLAGKFMYFFKKDSKIYEVSGMSEEFIREIILKSEW